MSKLSIHSQVGSSIYDFRSEKKKLIDWKVLGVKDSNAHPLVQKLWKINVAKYQRKIPSLAEVGALQSYL